MISFDFKLILKLLEEFLAEGRDFSNLACDHRKDMKSNTIKKCNTNAFDKLSNQEPY